MEERLKGMTVQIIYYFRMSFALNAIPIALSEVIPMESKCNDKTLRYFLQYIIIIWFECKGKWVLIKHSRA